MTGNRRSARGRQNVVIGSGNITGGVTDSQVNIVTGDGGLAYNDHTLSTAAQDPWPDQLRNELTRIRRLLEEDHDPARAVDRDDAIEAVTILEAEFLGAQDSSPGDPKGFRRRVKELIGVLAPVAEIVGGVAALQAILLHL